MGNDQVDSASILASVPPIRAFQSGKGGLGAVKNSVNMFRGDVNLPLQLLSLPGRNGLDVNLQAMYESNVHHLVTTWNKDAPTGILGLGWSLGYEQIVIEVGGSTAACDNPMFLVADGGATQLVMTGTNTNGSISYQAASYQFWTITYFPGDQRWEIVKENGVTSIYGGGATRPGTSTGNSVEWGVAWSNWNGSSAQTAGQQQYARSWNLQQIRSPWGDSVTFSYQAVTQQVGQGGLAYTKACYLAQITDVYGRTVTYNYAPKTFSAGIQCEYQDPHKQTPDNSPDAYQSQYETNYLASLDVASETGTLLFSVCFSYQLVNYGKSSDPAYPYLWKRILTGVRQQYPGLSSSPGINFSYYAAADLCPGALQSITYPEGGTATYVFQAMALPSSRDVVISSPFAGATPRVWFGPDYVVTTWYNSTTGQFQANIYSWIGQWVTLAQPIQVTAHFSLPTLGVLPGSSSLILYYQDSQLNQEVVYLLRKDPSHSGQWTQQKQTIPLSSSTATVQVAGGEDFVFLYSSGFAQAFHGYAWDWRQGAWTTPPLPSLQVGATSSVALGSQTNAYVVCVYNHQTSVGSFELIGRNALGQWTPGFSWSHSFQIFSPAQSNLFPFAWSMGPSFAAATYLTNVTATQASYEIDIFQWNANYQVTNPSNPIVQTGQSAVSNQTIQWPVLATAILGGLVANSPYLLRYNGSGSPQGWLPFNLDHSPNSNANYVFGYGDDAAVMAKTLAGASTVTVATFNPNQPTSAGWSTTTLSQAAASATIANEFVTAGTAVYAQDVTGKWNQCKLGFTGTIDLSSIQNRAPNYIVCQDNAGANSQTHVAILGNGQVQSVITLSSSPQLVHVNQATPQPGTMLAGPACFVTYPASQTFDQATSLHLYQVLDNQVSGAVTDHPVSYIEIDSGYASDSPYFQSYQYDPASVVIDPDSHVAQYPVVTVTSGSKDASARTLYGSTKYFFSNGYATQADPFYQGQGWTFNYDAVLNGMQLASQELDGQGNLVSTSVNYYSVFPVNQVTSQNLFGAYARQVRADRTLDGVTQSVLITYDPVCGLQTKSQTSSLLGGKTQKTYTRQTTYAWQVSDYTGPMVAAHFYSAVAQTIDQTDQTVTRSSVTTWKNWNDPHWAWFPYQTFQWLGTGNPSSFDFGSGDGDANWLRSQSIVGRVLPFGAITETVDVNGVSTSCLYDAAGVLPIAGFLNSSLSANEAGYLGFEPYEQTAPWTLGSGSKVVSGLAHTGVASLQVSPGGAGPSAHFQSSGPGDFLFAFWAQSGPGFGTDSGTAAFSIQVLNGANPVGDPIAIPITDTSGSWQYFYATLPLDQLRSKNGLAPDAALSLSVSSKNQKTSVSIWLDDVWIARLTGQITARAYDSNFRVPTASLQPNGATSLYLYDAGKRRVASIGPSAPEVSFTSLTIGYHSRRGNQGAFNPSDPNAVLKLQARGGGCYENFYSGSAWQNRWQGSNPNSWTLNNGTLVYSGAGSATLTLVDARFTTDYGAHARIAPQGVLAGPIGFQIGASASIVWNPSTCEWQLTADGLGTPLTAAVPLFSLSASQFVSVLNGGVVTPGLVQAFDAAGCTLPATSTVVTRQASSSWTIADQQTNVVFYVLNQSGQLNVYQFAKDWTILAGSQALLFFADGKRVFSYLPKSPLTGSLQYSLPGSAVFSNMMAFANPVTSLLLQDGGGRTRQKQALTGNQAIVSQRVFDPLGRNALAIKPAFVAPDGTHDLLSYRDDYVTAVDWNTGVIQGLVASAYPNDAGFPYRRQLYEPSPRSRVIERGAPGQEFAINPAIGTSHTVRYEYGASDGSYDLPAGEYFATSVTDQEGVNISRFDDKTGAFIGKAAVAQSETSSQAFTAYDDYGNPIQSFEPNSYQPPAGTSAADWVINRSYDIFGRTTQIQTPDSGTTNHIYDLAGRIRFSQEPNGAAKGYILYQKYDAVNRLIEVGYYDTPWNRETLQAYANTNPSWPPATTWSKRMAYDGDGSSALSVGRLTQVQTSNGYQNAADVVETLSYDIAGNIVSKAIQVTGFNALQYQFAFAYDNCRNITQITYPGTKSLAGPIVAYQFDDACRLVAIGTPQAADFYAAYTYNADGTVAQESLNRGNGGAVASARGYNSPAWMTSIASALPGNGSVSQTLNYTSGGYAPPSNNNGYFNGQLAQQTAAYSWSGKVSPPAPFGYQYAYDSLGRLQTAFNGSNSPFNLGVGSPLTYDANGNLLSIERGGAVQSFSYTPPSGPAAATNRLYSVQNADKTVACALSYDLDGNVTQVQQGPATVTFALDPVTQRPMSIKNTGSGGSVQLAYDGKQLRVLKTSLATNTARLYLRGTQSTVLAEFVSQAGGDAVPTFYIYSPVGLIAVQSSGGLYYILRDQLNSTRVVLDQSGNVVAGYDYWPMGSVARSYGQTDLISYLFNGQELDQETGLYNFRARLYDSSLGRFYSPDPAFQFYSPYIFAANNPLVFTDPTGQFSWWEGLLMGLTTLLGIVATIFTAGAAAPAVAAADAAIAGGEAAAAGAEALAAGVEAGEVAAEAGVAGSEAADVAAEAASTVAPRAAAAAEASAPELEESAVLSATESATATRPATSSAYGLSDWANVLGQQGGSATYTRVPFGGRLSFLDDIGLTAYNVNITVNDVGDFNALETTVHEGTHEFIATYLPFWTQASKAYIGNFPIGAGFDYLNELVAYNAGYIATGRIFMIPFSPLMAAASVYVNVGTAGVQGGWAAVGTAFAELGTVGGGTAGAVIGARKASQS